LPQPGAGNGDHHTEESLDATPPPQAFGQRALNAVIEGKADLGTVADTPIMFAVMSGKKVAILAVIQTSNKNEAIVARLDRGIAKPSDLKGKTIGVSLGTASDFFAETILIVHGIDRKQVNIEGRLSFVSRKTSESSVVC
jgi:NitT/TauT family transport system substrate-binding protein